MMPDITDDEWEEAQAALGDDDITNEEWDAAVAMIDGGTDE